MNIKNNIRQNGVLLPRSYIYMLLGLILVVLFVVDLLTGSVYISFEDIIMAISGKAEADTINILSGFRLPRALTALLAGMALSVSGLQMQTVFRNPLAGPYVLGISSGASLGVAILILGLSSVMSVNISMAARVAS